MRFQAKRNNQIGQRRYLRTKPEGLTDLQEALSGEAAQHFPSSTIAWRWKQFNQFNGGRLGAKDVGDWEYSLLSREVSISCRRIYLRPGAYVAHVVRSRVVHKATVFMG